LRIEEQDNMPFRNMMMMNCVIQNQDNDYDDNDDDDDEIGYCDDDENGFALQTKFFASK